MGRRECEHMQTDSIVSPVSLTHFGIFVSHLSPFNLDSSQAPRNKNLAQPILPGNSQGSARIQRCQCSRPSNLIFFLVFLSGEICSKLRGSNNVLALLKPKRASKKGPKATAGRAADRQRDEKDENTVYDSCPWPERMDGQALAHKNGLDGQTRTPLHVVTRTSGSS